MISKISISRAFVFILTLTIAMGLIPHDAQAATFGGVVDSFFRGVDKVLDAAVTVLDTVGGVFSDLGLGWLWRDIMEFLFGVGTCGEMVGNGVGRVICNVVLSTDMLPALISAIAYMLGMMLSVIAVVKLKDHVSNPQQVPLSDSIKRFVAGGALFSLPTVSRAVYELVAGKTGKEIASYDQGRFSGELAGGGLDTMIYMLVADIWQPLQILFAAFAYIAGLVFVVIGISRIIKTAQDGPKGPTSLGTIMTFVTAGVLFSLDRMMGAFSASMFGTNVVRTYAMLSQSTGNVVVNGHIEAVISSVIGFMALVGWISFIRGFFILRDVAEGNGQASLMVATTHIFGGALAVNLGPLMNAVQSTFGLTPYGVIFGV